MREIGLATYNGEVLFFRYGYSIFSNCSPEVEAFSAFSMTLLDLHRVSGYLMSDKLEIPRLRVKKDWHVGLNLDPVDRSHPDVHDDQLIQEAVKDSIARENFLLHLLFSHLVSS